MSKRARSSKKATFAASVVAAAVSAVVVPGLIGDGNHADGSPGNGPDPTAQVAFDQTDINQMPVIDMTLDETLLTPDDDDTYTWEQIPGGHTVSAAPGNAGANSRYVYSTIHTPDVVNQMSCVTWDGIVDPYIQPGIAARHSIEADRTRAISVTNNVWGGARALWNVHLWDSAITDGLPAEAIGTVIVPVMGLEIEDLPAPPWSMCVRVQDTTLDFKVWPAASPEPEWDDDFHVGSLDLPDHAVFAGKPGFYAGHIAPGTSSIFTNHHFEDLDAAL